MAIVSPDAESTEFYGSWKRTEKDGVPILTSERDPTIRSGHFLYRWPKPFTGLFPFGGGLDDVYAQAHMAAIARRSQDDLPGARKESRDAAAPYVSVGEAPRLYVEFGPQCTRAEKPGRPGVEDALTAFEIKQDLSSEGLTHDERFRRLRGPQERRGST